MNSLKVAAVLAAVILIAACNPAQSWRKHSITKKEEAFREKIAKGKIDTVILHELLTDYKQYEKDYPTDTTSANYMFGEAELYTIIGLPQKSANIYGYIFNNFQQYSLRPRALFMQGFTYENELHNYDSARAKYNLFLNNYPNHPIAKDVRLSIANMGKSADQIMAEFDAGKKTADTTSQLNKK
jgi:tetratricopeptide (TPR) repeat protein